MVLKSLISCSMIVLLFFTVWRDGVSISDVFSFGIRCLVMVLMSITLRELLLGGRFNRCSEFKCKVERKKVTLVQKCLHNFQIRFIMQYFCKNKKKNRFKIINFFFKLKIWCYSLKMMNGFKFNFFSKTRLSRVHCTKRMQFQDHFLSNGLPL